MQSWLVPHQRLLSQQLAQGRLAHAILFAGVAGAGKSALANWLVQALVCRQPGKDNDQGILFACQNCKSCRLYRQGSYPDFLSVTTDAKNIGVDDIRAVSTFVEKKAHLGQNKVVLLPMAEKMTTAAANALLKTLEEPGLSCVLILVSDDLEMLLPTITSRCRLYDIRPLSGQALLENLGRDKGRDKGQAEVNLFANVSQLPELTDEAVYRQFRLFTALLLDFLAARRSRADLLALLNENTYAFRWLEYMLVTMARSQYNWLSWSGIRAELADTGINRGEQSAAAGDDAGQLPDTETIWQVYQLVIACIRQLKSMVQANAGYLSEKLLVDIEAVLDK
ncbi:DNA polymerase III subunit delta' [Thalassomonas viridans]|uniref:DNA-directed DNA polymerase n=1 Tax=Thalassomonas viridans TaxID=137584 RepID=A0AAF0C9L2_9GAMM|nr:DNA polymerase III subunit delta' [Thalassomonas viridans]WDE07632.1 DNA polymerase III subunit delta' [Thalassomonas viridans]